MIICESLPVAPTGRLSLGRRSADPAGVRGGEASADMRGLP